MPAPYPLSDHFNGQVFHNPGNSGRRGLAEVLRWRFQGKRTPWPARVRNEKFTPPPGAVGPGEAAVTFIGHATFLIRFPRLTVLTDPIFSERCSPVSWAGPRRARPPGLTLDQVPPIDLLVISHNHYDHLDLPSLHPLARRDQPRAVTLLGNRDVLSRAGLTEVRELDWWDTVEIGGLRVTATPARHFSGRGLHDRGRALWGGFMLDTGAGRLLFAGDSGMGPHWREIGERLWPPDLALLPIGAYEPRWFMAPVHMNPEEAVRAHLDLRSKQSIGMHFGTFQLTDEAIDAPPQELAGVCARLDVENFRVLGVGETSLARIG